MINKTVTPNMVRFESSEPGIRGKVELLAFVSMFTLKHVILTASDSWIKDRIVDGHSIYYTDFFGAHYEKAKKEEVI